MSDPPATGVSSIGQAHASGRHWFDIAAVALLGLGCLTGTLVLVLQGSDRAIGASAAEAILRQRVRELEQRLLERVPAAIEQRYRDY